MFGDRARIIKLKEELDHASKEMNELEVRYNSIRTVLESMVEGVIIVNRDTRIVSINSSAEKIFGILKRESEGRFFLEAVRNNDIVEVMQKVLKNGDFISQELDLVWPVQRIFQVNASPILENGRVSGCLIVIHDITEIRKLERVRSDFVANVSHELKTPLTSIKGFVETMLEGALEDKENSRHFLQIIQEHADRLDSLVNDLLDLSRLESKAAALEKKEVNIRNLADDILAGFRSHLKKRSVSAGNDLPSDLFIRIDEDKIGQVLTNLIDNAIKFNRQNGTVKIYSRDSGSEIKIFVEDSGIGIPAKDAPRIFERFYRVDKARSRELGGTGLGLSIVKHIIELHGGSVGVESTEGLGSKFHFSLPK